MTPERDLQVSRPLSDRHRRRPVTNQRYYDTIYQERYMGLPGDNAEGFTQGSPINYATSAQGQPAPDPRHRRRQLPLPGTEALINELIRHNKPFTMMAYPNRSHAISEGRNTTLHLRRADDGLPENQPAAGTDCRAFQGERPGEAELMPVLGHGETCPDRRPNHHEKRKNRTIRMRILRLRRRETAAFSADPSSRNLMEVLFYYVLCPIWIG